MGEEWMEKLRFLLNVYAPLAMIISLFLFASETAFPLGAFLFISAYVATFILKMMGEEQAHSPYPSPPPPHFRYHPVGPHPTHMRPHPAFLNQLHHHHLHKPVALPENKFQKRLDAIGYKKDLLDVFYDPVTCELMNDPINAITKIEPKNGVTVRVDYICDRTSYEHFPISLNGRLQPTNRQPIIRVEACEELRATIDRVIKELEEIHKENQDAVNTLKVKNV